MKNRSKILAVIAAATLSTFFYSCSQQSDLNELQEAQLCLNKAAPSEARNCVSKLSDDSSALASNLKCAAIFISEGFNTPASFVDALDSLNSSGSCTGGCSSTINAMTAFKFTSADVSTGAGRTANNATATEAFNVCSQSDAKIYTQISSLFKLGTMTSMLAYATSGGAAIDEDDLKTEISNLPDAELGNIVTTTYNAACTGDQENASDSTQAQCTELENALKDYTTDAQIGACLKIKLANPAGVCP